MVPLASVIMPLFFLSFVFKYYIKSTVWYEHCIPYSLSTRV